MNKTLPLSLVPSIVIAGIAGELFFETVGLWLAPFILGMAMKPALLVVALARSLGNIELSMAWGWAGHLFAGIVLFRAGYVAFRKLTRGAAWPIAATLWGVVLWVVAQGVLAPLAGRPFMLGFIPYTWASLIVHIAYAIVVAVVFTRLTQPAVSAAGNARPPVLNRVGTAGR